MIEINDDEDIACLGMRRADRSDFFAEIRREERAQLLHALATDCFAAARYCPSEAEAGEGYLAELLRLNSAGVIGDARDQAAAAAAEAAPKYSSPGDLAMAVKKSRPGHGQRRPSIAKMIKQAEKCGREVTSVTLPDGTKLDFSKPESTTSNDLDNWLAKHARATERH
jgi:hypothetical protein